MKIFRWMRDRLRHKVQHFSVKKLLDVVKRHGVALVVITVGWEIIEDVLFPLLFVELGNRVHPAFYGGVPVAWMLCLHWLVVPMVWSLWVRLRGGAVDDHGDRCDHDH